MELIALKVSGWRRFATPQTLQTPGKLVAILGPNEAGKSSLLQALEFLRKNGVARPNDTSRGVARKQNSVTGYFFALAEEELKLCKLSQPTRLILTKQADDEIPTYKLGPQAPNRDGALRKEIVNQLDRCLNNRRFRESITEVAEEKLQALSVTLKGAEPDLGETQLLDLENAAVLIGDQDIPAFPKYAATLKGNLESLFQHESDLNPSQIAGEYITENLPKILLFGKAERALEQSYALDDLLSSVPAALENLMAVANLNIKLLVAAVNADDAAEIESIRAAANAKLKSRFEEDWSQSGVSASFSIKDRNLNIIIESEATKFTNLAERSDGFRQFVALQSFTMKERADKPILLIDEAETHLHYDAQADLIQMLYRQDVASKVIYSTHSAGCLPEDLGNGVRLIASTGPSTSKIINRFWGSPEPGFSPLLIGMGASTLAFFPIRKALLVEGEAEMILLPTLLRHILGAQFLGFQIVPGLAKANKSQLPLSASRANHVGYLVDGDVGGRALAKELRANHVPDQCIFSLDKSQTSDWEFEDLLSDALLLKAANQVVRKFSPGAEDIKWVSSKSKKFVSLAAAFEISTKKTLSKVNLAYEVLEQVSGSVNLSPFDSSKSSGFKKLAGQLQTYFKPD